MTVVMRGVIFLVVLLLHACKPFAALNLVAPRDGIVVTQNIEYAAGSRHTLDVYAPKRPSRKVPVVVFFYGGGWETGEKASYRFVGAALAARGLVTVIPDYRLYPQVQFPAFVRDAAAAVGWAHANVAQYGGDPRRLFLMGHSAGAHIATLLALDPEYLASIQLSPHRDICGVIGLAGLYDFPPLNDEERAIFGPVAIWPRSQPINYVSAGAPPMLLLAGRQDGTVDPGNTLRLAARLRQVGVPAEDELYAGISHTAIIASIGRPLAFLAPVREATLHFVESDSACRAAAALRRE